MSKQKYTVSLADTATEAAPSGVVISKHVIKVPEAETVEHAALDFATEQGQKDNKHYLVVNIERGA